MDPTNSLRTSYPQWDALHCQKYPIILYRIPPGIPYIVFLAGALRIQKGSGYACKVWSPSTHIRLP